MLEETGHEEGRGRRRLHKWKESDVEKGMVYVPDKRTVKRRRDEQTGEVS